MLKVGKRLTRRDHGRETKSLISSLLKNSSKQDVVVPTIALKRKSSRIENIPCISNMSRWCCCEGRYSRSFQDQVNTLRHTADKVGCVVGMHNQSIFLWKLIAHFRYEIPGKLDLSVSVW
jgi:hypothetical protein